MKLKILVVVLSFLIKTKLFFNMLLKKSGVRLDRVRGGRQKYKRKIDSTTDVTYNSANSKRMRGCSFCNLVINLSNSRLFSQTLQLKQNVNLIVYNFYYS